MDRGGAGRGTAGTAALAHGRLAYLLGSYALLAAVALIRASAERRGIAEAQVVTELAQRHGVPVPEPPASA